MKKLIIILLLSSAVSPAMAQQDLVLYQLSGVPQRNMVNPAFLPDSKVVFGFPVLASVNANYNNVAFSVNDGFVTDGNTLVVNPDRLLSQLKDLNTIYNQEQLQWFLFGITFDKNYIQVGFQEKVKLDLTLPKSLFELLFKGNAPFAGEKVSLENLSFNGLNYRELSLGYGRILNKWRLGVHANILFGLANVYTRFSSLGIYTDPDKYDITVDGNIEVNTSGMQNLEEIGKYLGNFSNMGFSADVGAIYHLNTQWELSASLLDLGFIKWKNDVRNFLSNGKTFELKGIDIKDYIGENLDSDSLVNAIRDSISDIFTLDENHEKYGTPLRPQFYIGGKFYLNEKHRFYGTVNLQFFREAIRPAFSVGYEFRLERNLSVTANYSYFSGSWANLGVGLMVRGGPLQFYFMSDNVLAAFNMLNYMTIHYRFGINFTFKALSGNPNTPGILD